MRISPYKIFTYIIVIIAYIVVIYKLITYDSYANLWHHFSQNLSSHWFYLLFCIALMPLNILSEAIKWRYAVADIEKISIKQAILATLKGQVGAIATPNKLGDFPTRALSLQPKNRIIGTIMGFISAGTMTLVIIIVGLFSTSLYITEFHTNTFNKQYLILTTITCIATSIFIFSIPTIAKNRNINKINSPKIKNILTILSTIKTHQLISLNFLSFIRFCIFCTQLFMILHFFDININTWQAIISIPTIYLLTTITPTIAISEAATRSSYAIIILTPICNTAPTIALATTLLWCMNCGFPIISGSFLFNKNERLFSLKNIKNN